MIRKTKNKTRNKSLRKIILLTFTLVINVLVITSCSAPKNIRNSYCSQLKNSKLVNIQNLEKGDSQTLRTLLTEYRNLKNNAPPTLIPYWETLISNTDKAINDADSQVLDSDTNKENPYIVAYKKILNDYNNNCI